MSRAFAKPFYKSKAWQTMREYCLIRDKYKCCICGGGGVLEVHHKIHLTPENINDASITLKSENLITLCKDCHFKQHEKDKLNSHKKANDCGDEYCFDADGNLVQR